jgi:hypothetical protein
MGGTPAATQGRPRVPIWLKVILALVALALLFVAYLFLGWLVALLVPLFLWRDWLGARSWLHARLPIARGVNPGPLALVTLAVFGSLWVGSLAAVSSGSSQSSPTPAPSASPISQAELEKSGTGTPTPLAPTATVPPATPTPPPTATAQPTVGPATQTPVPALGKSEAGSAAPTATVPARAATQPTPPPTSPPVPTVTPTPRPAVPSPTPTPATTAHTATAWVSVPNPSQRSPNTVFGKLVSGSVGAAGAQMYAVAHYKSTNTRIPESGTVPTGTDGVASAVFNVGGASSGYTVVVDVYLTYQGQTYKTTTSFTPK